MAALLAFCHLKLHAVSQTEIYCTWCELQKTVFSHVLPKITLICSTPTMLVLSLVVHLIRRRCFLSIFSEVKRASCPWPHLIYARLPSWWAMWEKLGRYMSWCWGKQVKLYHPAHLPTARCWGKQVKLYHPAHLPTTRPSLSSPCLIARQALFRLCLTYVSPGSNSAEDEPHATHPHNTRIHTVPTLIIHCLFFFPSLGGTLKTPASADKESLQAKWVDNLGELSLRGNDIYPLIHRAKQYWERQEDEPWHPILLPVDKPHTRLLLRLVIAIRKRVKCVLLVYAPNSVCLVCHLNLLIFH